MKCAELFNSSDSFIKDTEKDYLRVYNEQHTDIDMLFLVLRNGDKKVIPLCEDADTRNNIINGILAMNDYKYRNLYRTITQDYNPIENYDRREEGTITDSFTKSGSEEHKGNTTNNRSNEQDLSTTKVGSEKITTTNNLSNTESIGLEKITVENGVKAFNDTDTYADDSKSTTTNDARENISSSTGTIENDTTFTDRSDSTRGISSENITESTLNTLSFDNRVDENVRNFTDYRIHGNIGVTTTAQMLEGERKLSYFSFIEIVYKDILNEITKGVW